MYLKTNTLNREPLQKWDQERTKKTQGCKLFIVIYFKQITNKLVTKLQYKIITIVNVTYRNTELSHMLCYI